MGTVVLLVGSLGVSNFCCGACLYIAPTKRTVSQTGVFWAAVWGYSLFAVLACDLWAFCVGSRFRCGGITLLDLHWST